MFQSPQEVLRHWRRKSPSWILLVACLLLVALGLVALSSAGAHLSEDAYYYFKRQILWLLPSLAGFIFLLFLRLDRLRPYTLPLAILTLLLLGITLLFGKEINGAKRWLDLGFFNLQTSEPAKLALCFILAHYLALHQRCAKAFKEGFAWPCALLGAFCLLILLQPDFGTTALFATVGFILIFLASAPLYYLVPTGLLASSLFALAIWMNPLRWERITAFLNVAEHKQATAYQLWQSLLAYGSGGLMGVGLGQGRQQRNFLPESHTDFILSVLGEELGLVGTLTVTGLWILILCVGWTQLAKAPNLFECLLAGGCLLFLTLQSFINIAVVTGLLPTKGIALPFISYGGSSLFTSFCLLAVILNCLCRWQHNFQTHGVELAKLPNV